MEPQAGMILEGKVTSITNFGAFVSLENHRSGLVHISEIANTYVSNVRDYLEEGQTVKVLVLSADNGKINLSIKKALSRSDSNPPPASGGGNGNGIEQSNENAGRTPNPNYTRRPASSRPARPASAQRMSGGRQPKESTLPPSGDQAFEDKLKRFLSSSEGKIADLNRGIDGKRGGGRRKR